jgi:hypothetical protein
MRITRRFTLAAVAAAALSLFAPGSAAAQQQVGLVNVNVEDVTIQAPISVAANICNVSINVIATDNFNQGDECHIDQSGDVVLEQQSGNNPWDGPQQTGLVNINIEDVTLQVPIRVAANVCNLAVNVIASGNENQGGPCTIDQSGDIELIQNSTLWGIGR